MTTIEDIKEIVREIEEIAKEYPGNKLEDITIQMGVIRKDDNETK